MKTIEKVFVFLLMPVFVACTEDIVIDLEEGEPLMGVEASFTDELKRHEAILSRSADFYNSGAIEMVSEAQVFVTDGIDTVYYIEDETQKGHYFTEPVAGQKNTLYTLHIAVPDATEINGYQYFKAESVMPNNAEMLDSIVIKPFESLFTMEDTVFCLYPFFQCPDDASLAFMIELTRNDTLLSDTLTQKTIIPAGGYAGYYINGEAFLQHNMMLPVASFRKSRLIDGTRFKLALSSVTSDYMSYVYSIRFSNGNNPMMGAPSNVPTNIQPVGKAVGWFNTASVISAETVYHRP